MADQHLIYITCSSVDEAKSIAKHLVTRRLAACANVLGAVTSFYWWQEALQEDAEAAVIAKTRADLVAALVAEVKAQHSYDCPCVVALPIAAGNPDFLSWIAAETRKDG